MSTEMDGTGDAIATLQAEGSVDALDQSIAAFLAELEQRGDSTTGATGAEPTAGETAEPSANAPGMTGPDGGPATTEPAPTAPDPAERFAAMLAQQQQQFTAALEHLVTKLAPAAPSPAATPVSALDAVRSAGVSGEALAPFERAQRTLDYLEGLRGREGVDQAQLEQQIGAARRDLSGLEINRHLLDKVEALQRRLDEGLGPVQADRAIADVRDRVARALPVADNARLWPALSRLGAPDQVAGVVAQRTRARLREGENALEVATDVMAALERDLATVGEIVALAKDPAAAVKLLTSRYSHDPDFAALLGRMSIAPAASGTAPPSGGGGGNGNAVAPTVAGGEAHVNGESLREQYAMADSSDIERAIARSTRR